MIPLPPPVWIVYCYCFYVLEKVSTTKGSFVAHPFCLLASPRPPNPTPPPAAVLRPLSLSDLLVWPGENEVGENQARAVGVGVRSRRGWGGGRAGGDGGGQERIYWAGGSVGINCPIAAGWSRGREGDEGP